MNTDFTLRIYMLRTMKRIEKIVAKNESDVISGDDLSTICHTFKQLKVLHALEAGEYIRCSYCDGSIYPHMICYQIQGSLYLLERTELWINRIISFILGILTALIPLFLG